jgi:hypothetical protein
MARIRSIKPEVRTSLVVASWPREVRYLWILLWGYLDDHGRGADDARLIKADCLPLDDDITAGTVAEWVTLIATSGSDPENPPLCRYEVNGKRYLHAPNWSEHQRPSHPARSRFPKCPAHEPRLSGGPPETLRRSSRDSPEVLAPEQGAGSREVEQVQEPSSEPAPPADPPRADVQQICNYLADRIENNGSKRPTITKRWRDSARLLIDRDGRTPEQIRAAIDWCQSDEFWRSNVLSMPKLREKYDQLRLAAQHPRSPSTVGRAQSRANARYIGDVPTWEM